MAITTNPLMQGVTGTINKQIVFRRYRTKTVVSAYPNMNYRILSPKQIQRNEIMQKANIELKLIKGNEKLRNAAQLRLNVPNNRLHHALLKELLIKIASE